MTTKFLDWPFMTTDAPDYLHGPLVQIYGSERCLRSEVEVIETHEDFIFLGIVSCEGTGYDTNETYWIRLTIATGAMEIRQFDGDVPGLVHRFQVSETNFEPLRQHILRFLIREPIRVRNRQNR